MLGRTHPHRRISGSFHVMSGLPLILNRTTNPMVLKTGALKTNQMSNLIHRHIEARKGIPKTKSKHQNNQHLLRPTELQSQHRMYRQNENNIIRNRIEETTRIEQG